MPNHWPMARRLLLAVALPLTACTDLGPAQPARPGTALVDLPRSLSAAEQSVLSSSNAFSFALWARINAAQPDSNVFVSPLSASFSLGMALNGAANQTFDEMRSGLQFGTTSLADVDAGYKSLIALLTSLDPSVTMEIANSIWYRNDFPFTQTFLDAGSNYFSATIKPLNFNDAPGSLAAINSWVSDQTHGRIPTILQSIESSDVMYLINAIYFKGSWRTRFDAAQTVAAPFHSASGDQPARLMHRHGTMSYAATPTYQAVDLPYGDSAFTMTVVLPDPSTTVGAVASSLDAAAWQALTTELRNGDVDLYLPKVMMSWERDLIPDLEALGMHVPFSATQADFTKMSPVGGLYISFVKQKTFVDINEEGTEAAAVTATGVSATSVSVPSLMRVDRPFIFTIRERLSGAVLFMGKVVSLP
jgi:serine protease inhibitor